jgi:hypothetical protein
VVQYQTEKFLVAPPVRAGSKPVAPEAAEHWTKPERLGHQDQEQSWKENQPERVDGNAYEDFACDIAVVSSWQRGESLTASLGQSQEQTC